MKNIILLSMLVLVSAAFASDRKVIANVNPAVSLDGHKTYGWSPTSDVHESLDAQIRKEVASWLEQKGYQASAAGATPDFWVGYRIVKTTGTEQVKMPRTELKQEWLTRDFMAGAFVTELWSSGKKDWVWRGAVTGKFYGELSKEDKEKLVPDVCKELFSKLPKQK